jgi:hypothetical protein
VSVRVRLTLLNVFVAQLVLEHLTFNEGVTGSSPVGDTISFFSSVGRALPLHGRCRWFESSRKDKRPVSHSGNCRGL